MLVLQMPVLDSSFVILEEDLTDSAVVSDEGHTHTGTREIEQWIAAANEKYRTAMKPLAYAETDGAAVLTAENAGTFPGSPITLKYHLKIAAGRIDSLRITG